MSPYYGATTKLTDYIKTNPRNANKAEIFYEPWECRATQTTPRYDLLLPGEPVSVDLEFQHYMRQGCKGGHRLGRPSIKNTRKQTVLDVYGVYPREEGVRKMMPPAEFNVDKRDLLYENGAVPAYKVEKWIKDIVKGRKVIVHGGKHDLTAFQYEEDVFAESEIIDTQIEYSYLQRGGTPSLKTCAAVVLGKDVQVDGHLPTEDAETAMELFLLKYPDVFDVAAAEAAALHLKKDGSTSRSSSGGNNFNTPHVENSNRANHFAPRDGKRNLPKSQVGTTPTALHGRAINTLKRTTDSASVKKVEDFKLSVEDDAAFPALGAVVPGKGRR